MAQFQRRWLPTVHIRRKIWSSFGSVVKIIKSVKPNNEEKTSSSAFILGSQKCQQHLLCILSGCDPRSIKESHDTHKTEMLRCLHETYIRLTSNIFKAYQTNLHYPILRLESAGKGWCPSLGGEIRTDVCHQLVTSKNVATTKQHFSIEAMPCYAHITSHGILQHLMIVCKSAGQTCLGRAESCDLCARSRSREADQTWQPWEYFAKFDKIHSNLSLLSSAFLEHRNLWKLLPNSCQTKQNRWRDNPYPVEILRLTTSDQFHTIKGHSLAFHWPLLPKNVTIDFKLHFSGSSS